MCILICFVFPLAAAYKLPCQVYMSMLVPLGMCFSIKLDLSVCKPGICKAKRELLGTVLSPEAVLCWSFSGV